LSKTGGGRGTNQYGVKGAGKTVPSKKDNRNPEGKIELLAPDPNREWDLHTVQFGETPLDEDARDFLTDRYQHIQTKDELNVAESENIFEAMEWLNEHPFNAPIDLLNQSALLDLHRRMYGQVWTWAGHTRQRETNIGIDPLEITHEWEILLRNTQFQIENETHPPDEICVRLHRRMLQIHCFPNGNGRHARLVANELGRILELGTDAFTWGQRSGEGREEELRRQYLDALKHADATDDYGPLIAIATS
jgi:Fic-DOC domain mobile mystery protein B